MKIYLLTSDRDRFDEADGFVVAASSPAAARRLASEQPGDEGSSFWLKDAKCETIGSTNLAAGIVLKSFCAG